MFIDQLLRQFVDVKLWMVYRLFMFINWFLWLFTGMEAADNLLVIMFIYLSETEVSCPESHHEHNQETIGMSCSQALVVIHVISWKKREISWFSNLKILSTLFHQNWLI